jgi:hypothetical protein
MDGGLDNAMTQRVDDSVDMDSHQWTIIDPESRLRIRIQSNVLTISLLVESLANGVQGSSRVALHRHRCHWCNGLKCQDLRLQELLEYREQLIMSSSIQVGRETVNVYNSLCSPKLFIHP